MARYANNSNYRNDSLIRKEMCVSDTVVDEVRRIVRTSEIMKEDDAKWPQKNKDGRQELEIRIGGEHISFEVRGQIISLCCSVPPPRCCGEKCACACACLGCGRGMADGFPAWGKQNITDGENRLSHRRHRVSRSRGPARLLLPRPGPQGPHLQPNLAALQDQAHLIVGHQRHRGEKAGRAECDEQASGLDTRNTARQAGASSRAKGERRNVKAVLTPPLTEVRR